MSLRNQGGGECTHQVPIKTINEAGGALNVTGVPHQGNLTVCNQELALPTNST